MSYWDVNRDGYVTRADFNQMYGGNYWAANASFNSIDRNHDGIISPKEQAKAYKHYYGHYGYRR